MLPEVMALAASERPCSRTCFASGVISGVDQLGGNEMSNQREGARPASGKAELPAQRNQGQRFHNRRTPSLGLFWSNPTGASQQGHEAPAKGAPHSGLGFPFWDLTLPQEPWFLKVPQQWFQPWFPSGAGFGPVLTPFLGHSQDMQREVEAGGVAGGAPFGFFPFLWQALAKVYHSESPRWTL